MLLLKETVSLVLRAILTDAWQHCCLQDARLVV